MGENEHDGAGARGCGADVEPAGMAGLDPPHQRRPAEVGLLMYRKVGGGACGVRREESEAACARVMMMMRRRRML